MWDIVLVQHNYSNINWLVSLFDWVCDLNNYPLTMSSEIKVFGKAGTLGWEKDATDKQQPHTLDLEMEVLRKANSEEWKEKQVRNK